MDFEKRNFKNLRGVIALVVLTLSVAASTNIDCKGKAFHCVNSTHFMICVDVGSGLSSTIDNFVIPCPPTTECLPNNRFECEFPPVTSPQPIHEPLESTTQAAVADTTTVIFQHNNLPDTESPQNVSETIIDNYFNTVSPTTVSTSASTINEEASVSSGKDVTFETLSTTVVLTQNNFDIVPNNITTTAPNIVTSSDVTTNELPLQNSSVNEITTVVNNNTVDSTTETMVPSITEVAFVGIENNATSKTLFITDVPTQNYSDIKQNNITTTAPIIVTSSDVTPNELPLLNSKVNEITTMVDNNMVDSTTETIVPSVSEVAFVSIDYNATSKAIITTDGSTQNYSDIVPNNITTTVPNIVTSSDVTTNELPLQNSKVNEITTMVDNNMVDSTTETIVPSVSEVAFVGIDNNATSKTLFITDVPTQNYSDLVPNNITTTAPNIVTSSDVTPNELPLQNSSVNEGPTMMDITTETMVPLITEVAFVGIDNNATSKTLFITDVPTQNYSDLVPNNITTTAPNIVTSSDVTPNELPLQNSSVNEKSTVVNNNMVDSTTETIVPSVSEVAFVSIDYNATSKAIITTDGSTQNYSDIVPNNITTTVSNIVTYSDVTTNELPLQNSIVNEITTVVDNNMIDSTTETIVPSVSEVAFVGIENNATSKTLFITDVPTQNYSDLVPNNITTTAPNIVTSSDVTTNERQLQNSSVNEGLTVTGITTETMVPSITEVAFVSFENNTTTKTLITTDGSTQNYSDIVLNNITTTAPNIVTSSDVTPNELPLQNSSVNEGPTMMDITTETMVPLITEVAFVGIDNNATSKTLFITDVPTQNYSDLVPNNITTTAPNIVTSSDVTPNELPLQNSSVNEKSTVVNNNMVDSTTETIVPSVSEVAFVSIDYNATSKAIITTDGSTQNYSDIVPNNITTTVSNIVTYSDVTTNELPLQNSIVNEITTVVDNNMIDSTTETIVPSVSEVAFVGIENNATSKTLFITDVPTQNYSDLVPNNITTTAPNIVTSSDVTTNERQLQNSSVNEGLTVTGITTETMVPSITEVAFVSIENNTTTKTLITTDGSTQNYSDIVLNNITTTAPNIVTSSDVTPNELPLQNSSVNEGPTMMDITTETIVPSVSEVAFVSIKNNATSKIIITTEGSTQNYYDIVPNNITTTVPNVVTSSDVTTNELPLPNSSANEKPTVVNNNMLDSTTETMVPSVSEVAFVSIENNATSKTLFITDVPTQNYFDIEQNNITTTAPNIVTSSDVTTNERQLQNSSVNEITTVADNNMVDSTTETMVPSVSEVAFLSTENNSTSKAIITTDGSTQNYSDIVPSNITTTALNIVTSSDVTTNEQQLLNSTVNEGPIVMDITTETMVPLITEVAFVSIENNATSKILITTESSTKNYSGIVQNNIMTTVPNVVTSSDVTTNELPLQNSSVNEKSTVVNNNMVDSTTETIVPSVSEVAFVSIENNATSKIIITTEGSTQNYYDIVPNNVTTAVPNVVTSSDVTTNELPLQNSSANEKPTVVNNNMLDSTTETMVPSVSEVAFVRIENNATSKTLFITDVPTQNYFDIEQNNITTTAPNIVTSSDVTTNERQLQNSSVNEITTVADNNMVDSTTETMVPSVSEVAFLSTENNSTSKAIITTEGSTQNYSDIVPNNITTTAPNIVTSSDVTTNEYQLQNSSVNKGPTVTDFTTEALGSTVTEVDFVIVENNAISKTLFTTDVPTQNHSDIIQNNITTTAPNIVTSSDVTPNELPLQNSSVNEKSTVVNNNMVDSTTETIVPSVSEVAFVSIDYNATSKAIITTDGSTQNYSDIVPNNITTTVSNIVIYSDVTTNELPLQNSIVNEITTVVDNNMIDSTTETIVPSVSEVAFVGIENNATSKTLFITDVPTQNYSDLVPNNITTTVPNIVTSSDVTTNELPLQNSKVNEITTMVDNNMVDSSTETIVPSVSEVAFVSNDYNATSKAIITTDGSTQNYSDIVPNNITTTVPNVVTSSDVPTNELPLQNSSVNEKPTVVNNNMVDSTTETMVPSVSEVAFVSIENNATSKILITTDGSTQNYSDIVPNNITTTVPNVVTSSDVTTNELPLQNSSVNEKPTVVNNNMVDSTTETMVPSVYEVAFVSIENNATSKTLFITDVPTQNYSDIEQNNITTTAPNIVTSSDVTINDRQLQSSSVNEITTVADNNMVDSTTETMVPSVSEVAFVSIENNATSKILITTEGSTQNYSDIVPNNIMTTVPNVVTSSDVTTNELPLQNSSINEKPTVNNPWLINIESDNSKTYSTTNGDPSKITVSEKGYSSVAMSSPTEGYVAHIETHDVVLTHNTNKKHTQNQSVTYTETQSNIRVKNIANNTSHESKHKSSDNRHTNTYNARKTTFSCHLRSRGKYADSMDCRKFYICIGREQPIVGMCPIDTVFSEIRKQCTSNLSHCIRNNQFHCSSEGRFSDFLQNDIYYICIKGRADTYVRFKLQCQNGYYLNKTSVHCSPRVKETSQSVSSISDSSSTNSDHSATTSSSSSSSDDSSRSESTVERNDFQCKGEGKFADPNNCRRYYVCSKSSKLGYKIKRKSCDDDKVFNKDKKKCIDDDSLEC